jgi:hypothetical protein
VVKFERDQYEAVSGGMVTVTEVICYYVEFEPLYLRGELDVVKRLKEAVVDVYSNVLRFLALAKAYVADKKASALDIRKYDPFNSSCRRTGSAYLIAA